MMATDLLSLSESFNSSGKKIILLGVSVEMFIDTKNAQPNHRAGHKFQAPHCLSAMWKSIRLG